MQGGNEPWSPATHYGAATQAIESTAKWLVTAFAAVGVLMIGGVQLTGLGILGRSELPRLIIAIISLIVAIMTVGYMIQQTSAIFMTEWVTLTELSDQAFKELQASEEERGVDSEAVVSAISEDLASNINEAEVAGLINGGQRRDIRSLLYQVNYAKHELYGHVAPSIAQLNRRLREANKYAAQVAFGEVQLTGPDQDQDKVFGRIHELRNAARDVVECANYHRTRQQFNSLSRRLRWAVVLVLLSVLVFTYATNPPPKTEPVKVQLVTRSSAP
jgi:hypothetical protein